MHVQSCCFSYKKNYCFLTFSSPSASLDLKVPNAVVAGTSYQIVRSFSIILLSGEGLTSLGINNHSVKKKKGKMKLPGVSLFDNTCKSLT